MSSESKTYAIHPAIGVARLGNAAADPGDPGSFYIGPEAPYAVPNEGKAYKAGGRIKKQAQRFRIYEFADGVATREITLAEADVERIEWTVHLSNRKAALWPGREDGISTPAVTPETYGAAGARNETVGQRQDLVIDPGPQTVGEAGAAKELAGTIRFQAGENSSADVTLGTICAETGTGRLLVFAGAGISRGLGANGGFDPGAKPRQYANNDGWYDDTADGRVQATVTFRGGGTVTLDRPGEFAWVLCSVPKYVPAIGYFTTLHDVAVDAFADGAGPGRRVSFARDIYPVLRSISRLQWVSRRGSVGHSPGRGDYLDNDLMARLARNDRSPSDAFKLRNSIFCRLRNPSHLDRKRSTMPALPEEVIDKPNSSNGQPYDIAALTRRQYAMFEKWRDGDFDNDFASIPGGNPYVPLEAMAIADQPAALDLGALEGTAGTPMFPGIESWNIVRCKALYAAPLRIAADVRPGDLTIGNALPWQADYLDCDDTWWPVQRPTLVLRGNIPEPWVPAAWEDRDQYHEMVAHWSDLGFVVSSRDGTWFEEVERNGTAIDGPGGDAPVARRGSRAEGAEA